MGDDEKGIKIANRILQETESSEDSVSIRALVYTLKAEMLSKTDIKESLYCFNLAIEIFLDYSLSEEAIVSMINAGVVLAKSGNYENALEMYHKALHLIEENINNDSQLIIQKYNCYCNLAALYGRLGDNKEKNDYLYSATTCYLTIRSSEYESLLPPTTIITEQENLGFMMMSNGKIADGLSELNNALEKLNYYKTNISEADYYTYRFEILFDIAKGYAQNQNYTDAVKTMIQFGDDILNEYENEPDIFSESYLKYLKLMANLMLDLNYYETASYYYQKSIDEYNEITKYRKTGLNSFLPDILRQYARCLIDKGNIVDGLINLEKASNEYDKIIIQDNEYLESFVDTMIEYYYVTENNKNIEGFSPEEIEDLYNELAKRIKTKEECYTYFIFICIEMIFIYQRAGRIVESEKYIIELYHMLDRNNQKSNFSQSVFTFIGFSLDEIAQEKYSKRMLKDSILLSRMALEFINATEHLQKNVLQITQIIQRCANYHDEVGLKEEALNYYNQALKELEELEDSNHHVVLRKASILYDYGVAVTPLDFDRAEKILRNSIDLYQHFHDGKGQVAIQYADAEQALANILDNTERFHEAEKHYKSSVHVLSSISNEPLASERLGIALNNYGIMLMKQHRISEAKKTLRHSREIRLNSDPYGVIRTDDSLYRLALYEEKDEEAYIYLKEILEIQEKYGVILCGLLNEFTNYTDTFVQICIKINKINEAKLAYKKVYDMICNIPEDDMTDEMQGNKCIVRDRIYDIFKTVDFLTN